VENNIKGGALGATILKRRGNYLLDYWGKKIIPISRNWRKLSFYYFLPIFANWRKIPQLIATLLQEFLYS
jgi:hypothetical protein